jgi:16S rRNA (cytidine1402-2'-O)-methyltransferase
VAALVLVATPLGNLGDLTTRIAEAFRSADVVACEDTRVTRKLLAYLKSGARLVSVREANEAAGAERVIAELAAGRVVLYATDAGTPGVSDPGRVLVRRVIEAGHEVHALPGPSAVTTALALSGFSADRFLFAGFLPSDRRARRRELERLAGIEETIVIFESPHRMNVFLEDAVESLSGRPVVICRELTKRHEEIVRGVLGAIPPREEWRGELTIVIAGRPAGHAEDPPVTEDEIRRVLAEELEDGRGVKEASRAVAERLGIPARDAYALAIAIRKEGRCAPTESIP